MNILYKKGDLLDYFDDGWCDAIAHCCNCQGVMGSGIAYQIKEQFSEAYDVYKQFEKDYTLSLGTISYKDYLIGKIIVNLHAQNLYGYDGARFVDYEALYVSLTETRDLMLKHELRTLGVPYKMACDRAGGDWRIVESMLNVIFENSGIDVLVVEYEPK